MTEQRDILLSCNEVILRLKCPAKGNEKTTKSSVKGNEKLVKGRYWSLRRIFKPRFGIFKRHLGNENPCLTMFGLSCDGVNTQAVCRISETVRGISILDQMNEKTVVSHRHDCYSSTVKLSNCDEFILDNYDTRIQNQIVGDAKGSLISV